MARRFGNGNSDTDILEFTMNIFETNYCHTKHTQIVNELQRLGIDSRLWSVDPIKFSTITDGRAEITHQRKHLLVIILRILTNNVVEPKLINTLGSRHNPQPITQLLLLQKLLGQVLEITTAELLVSNNLDLAVLEVGDSDVVAEVAGQTLDLDALLEESGEGGWVEDLVVGWLGGVDGVL